MCVCVSVRERGGVCVCVCVCVSARTLTSTGCSEAMSSPSEDGLCWPSGRSTQGNSLQSVARISSTKMVLLVRNTTGRCVSSPLL